MSLLRPARRVALLLPALAVVACCAPSLARAQTSCWFRSGPTALTFPSYDPAAGAPTLGSASFQLGCNPANARVRVTLSTGSGSYAQRQMTAASQPDVLLYNLYGDQTYGTPWGDGTGGTYVLTNARQRVTYRIYGQIPVGQWVFATTYTDTITVTLLP